MNLVKNIISKYINDEFGKRVKKIDDNTELISNGYIDSFLMMSVVIFLEREFKIQIKDEDVTLDNFNTINTMSNLVMRYL